MAFKRAHSGGLIAPNDIDGVPEERIYSSKRRRVDDDEDHDDDRDWSGATSVNEEVLPEGDPMDISSDYNDDRRPVDARRHFNSPVNSPPRSFQQPSYSPHQEISDTDSTSHQEPQMMDDTEGEDELKLFVPIPRSYGLISRPATLEQIRELQARERQARMEAESSTNEIESPWTKREENLFIALIRDLGRNWKRIADQLPGRDEADVEKHFKELHEARPELQLDKVAMAAEAVVEQGDGSGHTNTAGFGRLDSRGGRMWLR